LSFIQDRLSTYDLFQDVCGFGYPEQGPGFVIVAVDLFSDGHDSLFEVIGINTPHAVLGGVAADA